MKKKALIVTALAGFIRSFLTSDIIQLQERGYDVTCAANMYHPGSDGMDEYFRSLGVTFEQIDFSSNKPFSRATANSYEQLKQLLKDSHFDLVHCHTPIAGALCRWACRTMRSCGTKVIYTTHGFYFHKGSGFKSWALFYPVEWIMSGLSDAIITINSEDYRAASRMRCPHVYHINGVGVDVDKFWSVDIDRDGYRKSLGIGPNDTVVLSVGELSRRKNLKVVIDALALLARPDIVLIHCGNAMNADNTLEEVKKAAEEGHVRMKMLGLRNDMPQICKCADIGTISSTREGLGLAGIEMLASGLPLVASGVHGILDYAKDGVNGYLANPYDAMSFAHGIEKLLDPDVRAKMRSVCHETALPFDSAVSRMQMKRIYDDVLGDPELSRGCR